MTGAGWAVVVGIEVESAGDMAGAIAFDTVVDGVVASGGVTISCVGCSGARGAGRRRHRPTHRRPAARKGIRSGRRGFEVVGYPLIPHAAFRKTPKPAGQAGFHDPSWRPQPVHSVFTHGEVANTKGAENHGALSILQPVPVDETDRPRCVAPGVRAHLSAAAQRSANLGRLHAGSASAGAAPLSVLARRPLVVRVVGVGFAEPS
jgi:hypothetical protein